jgi:hypothetical protein
VLRRENDERRERGAVSCSNGFELHRGWQSPSKRRQPLCFVL